MEVVKETKEFTIYQKRNKRYAVRSAERTWVSGDEKVKILIDAKLLDLPKPKAKPVEEAPAAAE